MPKMTAAFVPDLVTTMRWALEAASDRVPATSRTPATKARMAQRIVRSAHEGITDAQQLVAAAVAGRHGARALGPLRRSQAYRGRPVQPCELGVLMERTRVFLQALRCL
jgi:hypothetical protein